MLKQEKMNGIKRNQLSEEITFQQKQVYTYVQ